MMKQIKQFFCILGSAMLLFGCSTEKDIDEEGIKIEEKKTEGTPENEDIMDGIKESISGLFGK